MSEHPHRFLVMSGSVRAGEVRLRRAALRDQRGSHAPAVTEDAPGEAATVEWLDADGAVIAADRLAVHHTCGFPSGSSTTFSGALDHHVGAASIRVALADHSPAVIDAAAAPPRVHWRLGPASGDVLGATVDVAWSVAGDTDQPGAVEVSAWVRPVGDGESPAVRVPLDRAGPLATEGVVDLTGYGARSSLVLELWVGRVGSIATTALRSETFSTAPQSPTLLVRAPHPGAVVPVGVPVTCEALVLTGEPDGLTDITVQWTSSIQGALDQGSPVSVVLVPGEHELRATYGVGELAVQESVRITVER